MASIVTSRAGEVAAEAEAELFDIFDQDEQPLGTELRAVVHANGMWHRAVYCCVFNSAGQLLMQRRSAAKKVCPGLWDLSVAEHLQPGEPFRDGAARGLQEELGIDVQALLEARQQQAGVAADGISGGAADVASTASTADPVVSLESLLPGPLYPRHQRRLDLPTIGVKDYEFLECYRLDSYDGPVSYNTNEVSEVAWIDVAELRERMASEPQAFTPWFFGEAQLMGWLSRD